MLIYTPSSAVFFEIWNQFHVFLFFPPILLSKLSWEGHLKQCWDGREQPFSVQRLEERTLTCRRPSKAGFLILSPKDWSRALLLFFPVINALFSFLFGWWIYIWCILVSLLVWTCMFSVFYEVLKITSNLS